MSDELIRSIPLIRRYSRHNDAEDMRFRAYLLTLGVPDRDMDATVKEVTDEVWEKIDCLDCGNCCRTLEIVLDSADIKRLATRLGTTPKAFTQQYVRVAEDGTKYMPPACPFLDGNACTVYEDRPQSCRDFPYLYTPGFRQRPLIMIENCYTCPIVFNVWQTLKRRIWKRKKAKRRR